MIGVGSALLTMARVTTDGGRNWSQVVPPGVSRCAGGTATTELRPGSPSMLREFAHYSQNADYIPRRVRPLPFFSDHGIAVSTSGDRGLSWSQPTYVAPIPQEGEPRGQDRSAVTTDPTRPGVAYAVWSIVGLPANFAGVGFSRTTDHGRTWSRERVIYDQPLSPAEGATVSVLPDGTLVCSFLEAPVEALIPDPATPEDLRLAIRAIRSTDGGETWSDAVDIGDAADDNPRDPETMDEVRGTPSPRPAVTPDGTLHLVWYSVEGERSPLLYSRSRDGGRSFSRPTKIIDGPEQHFKPTLAAAKDGTLGLTYYDDRNDRPGDQQFTLDAWFTHSHDGGTSWEQDAHLAGPFDASTAPHAINRGGHSGRFLGEQQALAAIPGGFAAASTVAKPLAVAGPTDILFARVMLRGPAAADRTKPRIQLSVRPRVARGGRSTRFQFRTTIIRHGRRRAVHGAAVRLAGKRVVTNRHGRGSLVVTPRTPRWYRVRASKRGHAPGRARIRVLGSAP